jgi:hypothetical protein
MLLCKEEPVSRYIHDRKLRQILSDFGIGTLAEFLGHISWRDPENLMGWMMISRLQTQQYFINTVLKSINTGPKSHQDLEIQAIEDSILTDVGLFKDISYEFEMERIIQSWTTVADSSHPGWMNKLADALMDLDMQYKRKWRLIEGCLITFCLNKQEPGRRMKKCTRS